MMARNQMMIDRASRVVKRVSQLYVSGAIESLGSNPLRSTPI